MNILIIYLAGINIAAFAFYGIDKWKATRDRWRISEATLLGVAAVGGSVGAYAAMQLFRHKTKHKKFTLGVPLIFMIQAAAILCFYLQK